MTEIVKAPERWIDLDGATILVTGGSGSFGRHFIRTVLQHFSPSKLIVYSRDEQKQYDMQHDPDLGDRSCMRFFIGDVRDISRLEMAMRDVDYVVHAAALKHVATAEYNPFECIRTNVHGAENVVKAAVSNRVKKVVALSTDKAVNPINLYGASKLAADKIFVAAKSIRGEGGPEFAIVRYGNVVGSRGSVVPFFRHLIAQGADSLPITDLRMTRFWITLSQGVDFVLTSFAMMRDGSEVFVPKIPSMKVVDLAATMAPDLPMRTIGIRPGEKIHEVLVPAEEARVTVDIGDRYVICPTGYPEVLERYIADGYRCVADDFSYSSDKNGDWLMPEGLKTLLAEV